MQVAFFAAFLELPSYFAIFRVDFLGNNLNLFKIILEQNLFIFSF
jgi:hypothetical protein